MIPQRPLVRLGAIPAEPTVALPGSEEKIHVMIQRASRRQQLFHPMDGPRAKLYRPMIDEIPVTPWHLSGLLPIADQHDELALDVPEDMKLDLRGEQFGDSA